MTVSGIGNDSYFRTKKESSFNTAASGGDMLVMPVSPDSKMAMKRMQIENDVQVAARQFQKPNSGRESCQGNMNMDIHPSLIGDILNYAFGASDNDDDNADGTYSHQWIQALSGEREGTSFTMEQALGADLAERITGCTIHAIHFSGDNEGNLKVACDVVGKNYTADIVRIVTFIYPSEIPFNFSHVTINVEPTGVSAFDLDVNSWNLDIDLNYDIERFKSGSDSILQPVFNGVPVVNFGCEIDADQKFVDYARAITPADLTITSTSTEEASAGGKAWALLVELPSAILSSDTEIPNSGERMTMTLDFDCRYGGYTTNSPASNVMFEIGCTDTDSSYLAT